MTDDLTPAQMDSWRILQAGDEATIKLAEMKQAFDAANPPRTAPTPAQEIATAIDEILSRTSERSLVGHFLRTGTSGTGYPARKRFLRPMRRMAIS